MKGVRKCYFQSFMFLLVVFSWLTLSWADIEKARFVTDGTFALHVNPVGRKYPIITYVPTGFLLFDVDPSKQTVIAGETFRQAATQDGVRVYIPSNRISEASFSEVFGKAVAIFNSRYRICREAGCDIRNDYATRPINAGAAVVVKEDPNNPNYNVIVGRVYNKDQVLGRVNKNKMNELNSQGIITWANQRHPRYNVNVRDTPLADTNCDKLKEGSIPIAQGLATMDDEIVLNAFRLGQISKLGQGTKLNIAHEYGGKSNAYKHRLYRVYDNRKDSAFLIAAQIRYACVWDAAIEVLSFIEGVNLVEIRGENLSAETTTYEVDLGGGLRRTIHINLKRAQPITYQLKPGDTPKDLRSRVFGPYTYMWSVNTTEQYFELMEHLGEIFEDRALAGYFLSEFNRSCAEIKRTTEGDCKDHSYRNWP